MKKADTGTQELGVLQEHQQTEDCITHSGWMAASGEWGRGEETEESLLNQG